MIEYEIENKGTGELRYIYGYNWKDACRRYKILPYEWYVNYSVYVDQAGDFPCPSFLSVGVVGRYIADLNGGQGKHRLYIYL